ncbi:MAG: hypothetical protein LWX56_03185 [Ignavibacteria bacterium]|nr:hypothetical protein [Ignavibacteria bacterium]
MKNKSVFALLLAVCIANTVGFLLHTFNLHAYILLLGFRVHISFFAAGVSAIAFFKAEALEVFEAFRLKRILLFIAFILTLGGALFVAGYMKLLPYNDPDYIYEFGLSSLIDFPLYIFWNLPQFFLLFMLLNKLRKNNPGSKLIIPGIILLFAFELYPFFALKNVVSHSILFTVSALFIFMCSIKSQNPIEFCVWCFMSAWLGIFLFGTDNLLLIQQFFARNFDSWEGFVTIKGLEKNYSVALVFVISMLPLLFMRRNVSK